MRITRRKAKTGAMPVFALFRFIARERLTF
jgi:hypothetical protein